MNREEEARLAEVLIGLELQLLDPETRRNRTKVSALLAQGFREFGSSGRYWSRDEILDALSAESDWFPPAADRFELQILNHQAALLTYRTRRTTPATPGEASPSPQHTLRSSLWVLRDTHWQMLFHQGTNSQCND